MSLTYTGKLEIVSCTCGIVFGIPDALERQAQDHGKSVTCPLGHSWHYTESLEQKLEREQRAHRATRDLLHAEERSHVATRGHLTRTKKRVAAGVCPCCGRTFQQLARHMRAKHPDYSKEVTT